MKISQTHNTLDIVLPKCAVTIVLISVKESIFYMHSKIVEEVLKYKGDSGLHAVLYSMRQTVGNCYTFLSLWQNLTYATNG